MIIRARHRAFPPCDNADCSMKFTPEALDRLFESFCVVWRALKESGVARGRAYKEHRMRLRPSSEPWIDWEDRRDKGQF